MSNEDAFNSGSTLLQPIATALGQGTDKVNLFACMALSVPAAIYLRTSLGNSSIFTRQMYSLTIGLAMCYFCYGPAIKHIMTSVFGSYTLMHIVPAVHVHKFVFIFAMSHLFLIHFYRWQFMNSYTIDVTGPIMIIVQKVTTLAFSLHDGLVKKEEELNEMQKKEAVKTVPPLLPYLSYVLHFQTALTGPLCFYTDWIAFCERKHVLPDKNGQIPSPSTVAWSKLRWAIFFVICVVIFEPNVPVIGLLRTDLGTVTWIALYYFTFIIFKFGYYFAWTFADSIYNFSGFGFNGYEENGEAKWDLAMNVNPYQVETAISFKKLMEGWNISTMKWLRRAAFERAPKKYRVLATYTLSAVWHGLFPGYYITFAGGVIITLAGQAIRRSVRPHMLSSPTKKTIYDCITFLGAQFGLIYFGFPFIVLHLQPSLQMYMRLYFIGHLLCLFGIVVIPRILPPPKKKEEGNGVGNESKKEL